MDSKQRVLWIATAAVLTCAAVQVFSLSRYPVWSVRSDIRRLQAEYAAAHEELLRLQRECDWTATEIDRFRERSSFIADYIRGAREIKLGLAERRERLRNLLEARPETGADLCAQTFAVVGDVRPDELDAVEPNPVFLRMIPQMNVSGAERVFILGDLIRGYTRGDTDLILQQWTSFEAACRMFDIEYHLVPGNHEWWDAESERIYRRRWGRGYYAIMSRGTHFLVLNTEKLDDEQIEWIADEVDRPCKQRFVFTHTPIIAPPEFMFGSKRQPLTVQDPRLAALLRHKATAVFSGHIHDYYEMESDGIYQLVTGGGGAELASPEGGGISGFHFLVWKDGHIIKVNLEARVRRR